MVTGILAVVLYEAHVRLLVHHLEWSFQNHSYFSLQFSLPMACGTKLKRLGRASGLVSSPKRFLAASWIFPALARIMEWVKKDSPQYCFWISQIESAVFVVEPFPLLNSVNSLKCLITSSPEACVQMMMMMMTMMMTMMTMMMRMMRMRMMMRMIRMMRLMRMMRMSSCMISDVYPSAACYC